MALSAWQVRFRGSPALRLMTGPPVITGSSGGTAKKSDKRKNVVYKFQPSYPLLAKSVPAAVLSRAHVVKMATMG